MGGHGRRTEARAVSAFWTSNESTTSVSRERRAVSRPTGHVSKKAIGEWAMAWSSAVNMRSAARAPPSVHQKVRSSAKQELAQMKSV